MTNTRNYRTPGYDDDADVPLWNDRLAQDVASDVDALEDLAQQPQSDQEVPFAVVDEDGRRTWLEIDAAGKPTQRALDLLAPGINQRVIHPAPTPPAVVDITANPELSFAVVDEDGRRTWLEADTAGKPTQRAADLLAPGLTGSVGAALGISDQPQNISGLSFAVVDEDGRRTWLEADTAGNPTQRALDLIRVGIAAAGNAPGETYKATYQTATPKIVSGPDICCWGDSMTAGAGGNGTTYPNTVAALTGRTVYNKGVGGETSVTITARSGAVPMLVIPQGGQIPASGSVVLDLQPLNGYVPAPLIQGSAGYAGGTLAGVPGTISRDGSGVYSFTRSAAGAAVTCDRPTAWLDSESPNRRGDIFIIWIGQNGPSNARAMEDVTAIIRHMTALDKRFLVISRPTSTDADDALWHGQYGRRFVAIRQYLVKYGLADAGITPTTQDQTDMANGTVPTSLRIDGVHWTAAGYTILGQQITNRLKELGWV